MEDLNTKPAEFKQPDSVLRSEICAVTGAAVNEYCRAMIDPRRPSQPAVRIEFFANDQPPLKADQDIVGKAFIDKFSGLRVNQFCKDNWEEKFVVNLTDKSALSYLEKDLQGQKWAEILKLDSRSKTCRPTHAVKIAARQSQHHLAARQPNAQWQHSNRRRRRCGEHAV